MSTVPIRANVSKEQTWNAEIVFASRDQWREELQAVREMMPSLAEHAGKISETAENLSSWLDIHQSASRRIEKLMFYAYMATAVDSDDAEAVGMAGQIQSFGAQFDAETSFAEPELLGMDQEVLLSWIETHTGLQGYRQYINNILRLKPHYRSAEVEEVMGLVSDPFSAAGQVYQMLTDNDMTIPNASSSTGTEINVTQSNIESVKGNPDRSIRMSGMNNYADAYLSLKNTCAAVYITSAKQAVTTARIRGYDSVLEYKLSPHNLPTSVFHTLIDTFKDNLHVWHRYWDIKRRLLKLDEMRPHDIWAPLTENLPSFTYPEAINTICDGMSPLGSAYTSAIQKGCLEDRWVDYSQNQGKTQGAFSYGTYDTHPCILVSFDGSITEVSTLAHELGHSMHSFLTHKQQPYIYSQYSMFVAEVASNFNQAMVRDNLFKQNSDRDFQLAVIQEAMDNIHRYFFIMPTLARFEYAVYEKLQNGEPVNADILNNLMSSLYAEGYGETLKDDKERTSITWATFAHLYEPFYTFQYATGISAAHALCDRILEGVDGSVDSYLEFLGLGNSVYPLEALNIAGVDMTTALPIKAGFKVLESLIDRMEGLVE